MSDQLLHFPMYFGGKCHHVNIRPLMSNNADYHLWLCRCPCFVDGIQYVFTSLFLCLKQVLMFLNDIFDSLLKALSDPSDEVICSCWLITLPDNLIDLKLYV